MPYNDTKGKALLSTTAIASLASETETTLYTVPTGYKCVLSEAWLETAGDVGAAGVVTIGQNGAETDFVGSTNLDNLDADEDIIIIKPIPSATPSTNKIYAAGTVIKFDVATAGNAVAGVVYLFGFLIAV
jgi:hypothetical protein